MDDQDSTEPPAAAARRYSLRLLLASSLTALAVGLGTGWAAFHNTTPRPTASALATGATFVIGGSLTLRSGAFENDGATCKGYTGYTDISAGTTVAVADQDAHVIAVGALEAGVPQGAADRPTACVLAFNVTVPANQPFYTVTVSHRGAQSYTADQARQPIRLVLGSP